MIVYHGDNFATKQIKPELMNNGNNQEGVGIYFSNMSETAKTYGKDIVSAKINKRNFINSRNPVSVLPYEGVINMLAELKSDSENMYYFLSDYFELSEPEDVKQWHILNVYKYIKTEQVRNIQITLANRFGVTEFVRTWNKHIKKDGTYYKQTDVETWFAIINPEIKLKINSIKNQ